MKKQVIAGLDMAKCEVHIYFNTQYKRGSTPTKMRAVAIFKNNKIHLVQSTTYRNKISFKKLVDCLVIKIGVNSFKDYFTESEFKLIIETLNRPIFQQSYRRYTVDKLDEHAHLMLVMLYSRVFNPNQEES